MNFIQTNADPCIYVSQDAIIVVDDLLIAGKSEKRLAEIKSNIASRFEAKELGELHFFLIIQDSQRQRIWIGQPNYSNSGVQHGKFQIEKNTTGSKSKVDDRRCTFQLLPTRTQPDIAFAVSTLAEFTSKPTEDHWKAVKHLLWYIAGTCEFGLLFTMSELHWIHRFRLGWRSEQ